MTYADAMLSSESSLVAERIRNSSFVRHVEIYDELGSTNDRAAELAGSIEIPLPALVIARRQTAGRGRGTHRWWATDGALTFSVVIDTAMLGISMRDWPRLSLTMAVAICDALAEQLEPSTQRAASSSAPTTADESPHRDPSSNRLGIKWPNDVILDGAKVGGILIESPSGAATRERLVVGIGINVNNAWRLAPRESGGVGIALCDVSGRTHDLSAVLISALNAIQSRIQQLAENSPGLPKTWQQLCWLTEQEVEVSAEGKRMEGVCNGIDIDAALLVKNASGTQRFYSGSVKVL